MDSLSLHAQLKNTRKIIQEWNIKVNENVETNIKKREDELYLCDISTYQHNRTKIEKKIREAFTSRESMIRQKSRVQWDKEGD